MLIINNPFKICYITFFCYLAEFFVPTEHLSQITFQDNLGLQHCLCKKSSPKVITVYVYKIYLARAESLKMNFSLTWHLHGLEVFVLKVEHSLVLILLIQKN